MIIVLIFPHKEIRSKVILKYYYKEKNFVCFSSGNAVAELKKLTPNVIGCGGYVGADYSPTSWFSQRDVEIAFPNEIDVTCGHLPIELMVKLADAYREYLGELTDSVYEVPTGSGETIVCLKLAYPDKDFIAVYNLDKHTEYNEKAPLNRLVRLVASEVKGI